MRAAAPTDRPRAQQVADSGDAAQAEPGGTLAWMSTFAGLLVLLLTTAAGCGEVASIPIDSPSGDDDARVPPDTHTPVWSPYKLIDIAYTGNVRNPVVTGDGLNIYFIDSGTGSDVFDAFTASRASTSTGFGTPALVPVVNVTGQQERYLEISGDGLELYFSQGDLGPIMVSTRANVGAPFSTPVAVRTGITGNFPSISGDKLALYFIAQAMGINGELRKTTRTAVGQPWSAPAAVPLTGVIEIYSSIDVSIDELALLRAPSLLLTPPAAVVISRRASKAGAFDQNEVLAPMDCTTCAFASARWNANDTEIWTGQKNGMREGPWLSRLE